MENEYKDLRSIERLVESFENATVGRDEWRHAEHLVVALYYCESYDDEQAYAMMRGGIFRLLTDGFGIDLSKEMPYHETLTRFWMNTVRRYSEEMGDVPIEQKANGLVSKYDKDHPLKFYSRELLYSDEARNRFVGPDLTAAA